jgi:hypothetical protein
MSQENVEVVRLCYELMRRGDIAALVDLTNPEIEVHENVLLGVWKDGFLLDLPAKRPRGQLVPVPERGALGDDVVEHVPGAVVDDRQPRVG